VAAHEVNDHGLQVQVGSGQPTNDGPCSALYALEGRRKESMKALGM